MSLLRASLTLLVGNALAQLLPLLLGPWITRLYSPEQFAGYSLVWTAASNLAVVACARYEMALPLARGAASLRALLALCLRVWVAVTLLAALLGAVLALRWPDLGWLPLLVGLMGGVQALALLATRQRAFGWLAGSRFLQWGLAALLQVGLGYLSWSEGGPGGLLAGAALALALALLALLLPLRAHLRGLLAVPTGRWRAMARRHRDFPLLNTPHAFAGAAQDTLTLLLVALLAGDAAMGLWALALRYLKAPATLVGAAVSAALYPQLTQAASFADARRQLRRTVRTLLLLALPFALAAAGRAVAVRARVRVALAGSGRAGAGTGALHRGAFRGLAAGGGHHGLARAALGVSPGAGGAGGLHRRAGAGPVARRTAGRRLGRVGGDGAVLRLVLLAPGALVASPGCGGGAMTTALRAALNRLRRRLWRLLFFRTLFGEAALARCARPRACRPPCASSTRTRCAGRRCVHRPLLLHRGERRRAHRARHAGHQLRQHGQPQHAPRGARGGGPVGRRAGGRGDARAHRHRRALLHRPAQHHRGRRTLGHGTLCSGARSRARGVCPTLPCWPAARPGWWATRARPTRAGWPRTPICNRPTSAGDRGWVRERPPATAGPTCACWATPTACTCGAGRWRCWRAAGASRSSRRGRSRWRASSSACWRRCALADWLWRAGAARAPCARWRPTSCTRTTSPPTATWPRAAAATRW
jgi:hypothetical protein